MQKIMFNDRYGLTKAVLEGRKTMTRRVVQEKLLEAYYDYDDYVNAVAPRDIPYSREYDEEFFLRRSPFKVGEVVAVAQKYEDIYHGRSDREARWFLDTLHLRYDDKCARDLPSWRNKEFVLADLMPHQIRITDVRVERLQDITDEDCLKEGVFLGQFHTYSYVGRPRCPFGTPREAFASLIDRISGKGTWASNPWVFVYEFELVK